MTNLEMTSCIAWTIFLITSVWDIESTFRTIHSRLHSVIHAIISAFQHDCSTQHYDKYKHFMIVGEAARATY